MGDPQIYLTLKIESERQKVSWSKCMQAEAKWEHIEPQGHHERLVHEQNDSPPLYAYYDHEEQD